MKPIISKSKHEYKNYYGAFFVLVNCCTKAKRELIYQIIVLNNVPAIRILGERHYHAILSRVTGLL